MSRETIIAGNWKMYKTGDEAVGYIKELSKRLQGKHVKVYLAVPFTSIQTAAAAAKGLPIVVGAQNMHDATEGAFTGEIAGRMLADAGAAFVLLGHSERRRYFGETNAFINRKVQRAIADGLQPLLCIGESGEEHQRGKTREVLKKQLVECLQGLQSEQIAKVILAYEPVWAIGTGQTATPDLVQETHHFCRSVIAQLSGNAAADKIPILYGGSVNPENAPDLMALDDVDGVLVGGASLNPEAFTQIIRFDAKPIHHEAAAAGISRNMMAAALPPAAATIQETLSDAIDDDVPALYNEEEEEKDISDPTLPHHAVKTSIINPTNNQEAGKNMKDTTHPEDIELEDTIEGEYDEEDDEDFEGDDFDDEDFEDDDFDDEDEDDFDDEDDDFDDDDYDDIEDEEEDK